MPVGRVIASALVAASLCGATAFADVDLPIPVGCTVPQLEIDDAASILTKEGWAVQEIPTPAMFDALGWVGMPQYFAGDSGGADMDYVYEIKRRNAVGFAKLVDVPSSRSRILARGNRDDLDVLLLQWTDHHTHRFTLACSLGLATTKGADLRDMAGLGADHADFVTLPKQETVNGGAIFTAYAYVLNVGKIKPKLDTNIATGAVILTHLNFAEEDV